ncbi:MAG: mercury methylation corrinoid protein HgcA [Planctomycetota bacterium]|jgi:acetyl-CoA decarbonylase/synthase complex subunit gamma
MAEKILDLSFVTYKGNQIRQVPTELFWPDRLGQWKSRWGINRMRYMVEPGIYAVGNPDGDSPVFISANYKMSFDRLRSQLGSKNGWILVLNTKGINVWCAAGKGTFGTDELVNRIEAAELDKIVNHRTLIVPQLGASGVSAHEVKHRSGFNVVYGPVRAEDLPAFLDAGMKATIEMKQVNFQIWDRIVLIPVELIMWGKYALFAAAFLFIFAGFHQKGYSSTLAMNVGLPSVVLLLASFLAAAILGPILLPWLPGRAFSIKGVWIGLAVFLGFGFYCFGYPDTIGELLNTVAWLMIIPAVTSFVVMNFTGASTYTSLSGVKKEMKVAVLLQSICAVLGMGLWLIGRFV